MLHPFSRLQKTHSRSHQVSLGTKKLVPKFSSTMPPRSSFDPAEDDQCKNPLWSADDILKACQAFDLTDTTKPNAEQVAADLYRLAEKLQDLQHHDKMRHPIEVMRFLVTRGYKADKAERDFRKMVEWRQTHGVDTILQDFTPPEDLMQYYPAALMKEMDKAGHPVWFERRGVLDMAGMLAKYGHDVMLKHAIWMRERTVDFIQAWERTNQKPYRGSTIIIDLQSMPIMTPPSVFRFYHEVSRLDQDYYPGVQIRILLIRPPSYFRVIWGIYKTTYDPWFAKLMSPCSTDTLEQYIDLDQVLPPELGGKGTAIKGMANNFAGGKIPTSAK